MVSLGRNTHLLLSACYALTSEIYYTSLAISAMATLSAVYLANAWVCDDAYITFRSIDNLVNGLGPVWNAGERVQAFTHPLWFLLRISAKLTSRFGPS